MLPPGTQLWKLSSGGGGSLGVSWTEEGLFLGRTALVERHGQGYAVRAPADLERLLARTYGRRVAIDRVMPGFRVAAAALSERNLCLAQIAAVQLRLPDLSDDMARGSLETEDRLIKSARGDDRLDRSGWDPDEHPRAEVPPNRDWFAPTEGGQAQIAQGEEEERAPDERPDPMAPLRQAQWDAAIATLRQVDPKNPNLTYLSNPGSARAKKRSTVSRQRLKPQRSSGSPIRSCRARADRQTGARARCSGTSGASQSRRRFAQLPCAPAAPRLDRTQI